MKWLIQIQSKKEKKNLRTINTNELTEVKMLCKFKRNPIVVVGLFYSCFVVFCLQSQCVSSVFDFWFNRSFALPFVSDSLIKNFIREWIKCNFNIVQFWEKYEPPTFMYNNTNWNMNINDHYRIRWWSSFAC